MGNNNKPIWRRKSNKHLLEVAEFKRFEGSKFPNITIQKSFKLARKMKINGKETLYNNPFIRLYPENMPILTRFCLDWCYEHIKDFDIEQLKNVESDK